MKEEIKKHKNFLHLDIEDDYMEEIINNYVKSIEKVKVNNETEVSYFTILNFITDLREDIVKESESFDELFKNTEHKEGREIIIPTVINNEN